MNILCLCTGNTCRSPMLMTLMRDQLAQQNISGITVSSAGTSAHNGSPASSLAIQTMSDMGLDLITHRSQPITNVDINKLDYVLCMTSSHAAYARSLGIEPARLAVVNAENGGVPDPFGGSAADYAACAKVLAKFAQDFVRQITTPPAEKTPFEKAIAWLDVAHAAEPSLPSGKPSELVYATHISKWITQLIPEPSLALQLAARCQHLERWAIPRSTFPKDKPGYFAWRKAVHKHQGERAQAILLASGIDAETSARVAQLVSKSAPKGDKEAQALEDAACLTFLATELGDFAAHHPDYSAEKFIDIIRKTWKKMSDDGHRLALTIPLEPALKDLVVAAIK